MTYLLQAFLKGSVCLLCSSEQTNLRNYLSQSHFKKSLLSFGKMESPIEFICTYDFCNESFLSNYRLSATCPAATAVSRGGTREKMDKMEWQVLGRLSWLRKGRQGRGEEEHRSALSNNIKIKHEFEAGCRVDLVIKRTVDLEFGRKMKEEE